MCREFGDPARPHQWACRGWRCCQRCGHGKLRWHVRKDGHGNPTTGAIGSSLTSFVALESSTASTSAIGSYRGLGRRRLTTSIALGRPGGSLVDDLHRWLGFLVGVLIVIIAYLTSFSSVACSLGRLGMTSSYREARTGSARGKVSAGSSMMAREASRGRGFPPATSSRRWAACPRCDPRWNGKAHL